MLDETRKRDLTNRLRSAEGHIRAIQRMIDEDAYCMDILKQVKAVQKALEQVSTLTLENHLNTCVATAIRSEATTLPAIIREMLLATHSERQGRLIDHDQEGSMEFQL